jgi:hypothetical protein
LRCCCSLGAQRAAACERVAIPLPLSPLLLCDPASLPVLGTAAWAAAVEHQLATDVSLSLDDSAAHRSRSGAPLLQLGCAKPQALMSQLPCPSPPLRIISHTAAAACDAVAVGQLAGVRGVERQVTVHHTSAGWHGAAAAENCSRLCNAVQPLIPHPFPLVFVWQQQPVVQQWQASLLGGHRCALHDGTPRPSRLAWWCCRS